LRDGLWPGNHETWHIIEALTDPCDGFHLPEVVERYGRTRVDRIADKFGVDIFENVREPVEGEEVEVKEGQYSEEKIARATALACHVKWQLSNGKVRQESIIHRESLVDFSWLTESGPGQDTLFNINDDIAVWINPDTLDYISIPAHSFFDEQKKALAGSQVHEAAAKKKKRSG
jgi:hypothetical protein